MRSILLSVSSEHFLVALRRPAAIVVHKMHQIFWQTDVLYFRILTPIFTRRRGHWKVGPVVRCGLRLRFPHDLYMFYRLRTRGYMYEYVSVPLCKQHWVFAVCTGWVFAVCPLRLCSLSVLSARLAWFCHYMCKPERDRAEHKKNDTACVGPITIADSGCLAWVKYSSTQYEWILPGCSHYTQYMQYVPWHTCTPLM